VTYHVSAVDLNDGCESVTEAMQKVAAEKFEFPKERTLGFFPEEDAFQEAIRQRTEVKKEQARRQRQPYRANPNWGLF